MFMVESQDMLLNIGRNNFTHFAVVILRALMAN